MKNIYNKKTVQEKNFNNQKMVWRVEQSTKSGYKLVRYMDGTSETMSDLKRQQIVREVKP